MPSTGPAVLLRSVRFPVGPAARRSADRKQAFSQYTREYCWPQAVRSSPRERAASTVATTQRAGPNRDEHRRPAPRDSKTRLLDRTTSNTVDRSATPVLGHRQSPGVARTCAARIRGPALTETTRPWPWIVEELPGRSSDPGGPRTAGRPQGRRRTRSAWDADLARKRRYAIGDWNGPRHSSGGEDGGPTIPSPAAVT